ncbi:MAG TPA: heavy-metal-associated domain-containing protein [Panacibacter sp.]|nr:heavy-metal-associated domain-containing protein [Panacibacter sp.]
MKKILWIVAILFSLGANAQVTKATLTASGLTCSMCSKSIYEALKKVKTVESIKANIKESSYSIIFKKDAEISFDELKKAVEGAGFFVAQLKVVVNFDNTEIKNDTHILAGGLNFHFLNVQDQTLRGEKVLTVLDKNFVTSKEFKKYSEYTKMKCMETGVMEACCTDKGAAGNRVYHVTI